MTIVKTVKRIHALQSASNKAYKLAFGTTSNNSYLDLMDKIDNKTYALQSELKQYTTCPDRALRVERRKQIKLACKCLKLDYYRILR